MVEMKTGRPQPVPMKHDTPEYKAIADNNTILRVQVGSGLHGIAISGQDDRDEMALVLEPPQYVIGLRKFEQYEYRTQMNHVRSGPGDLDLIAYCHDPRSRVLTAELEWREIGTLQVGDKVISFDDFPPTKERHRHFSTGTVTAVQRRAMPKCRVITSAGETIVTPEHLFFVRRDNKWPTRERVRWVRADELQPGYQIYSVPTWSEDRSWGGGYLAGQFDGEASMAIVKQTTAYGDHSLHSTMSQVTWVQKATSPDVPYVESLLAERGFKTSRHVKLSGGCAGVSIRGGWFEQARFLGSVRPRRLLRNPRLPGLWEGRSLQGCDRAVVEAVEPIGVGEVVAMEVDTHTYIADGLLTHNSLRKWARLAAGGNPTVLLPLFAPDSEVLHIEWPGQDLRARRDLFLHRGAGYRFIGYLERQRDRMLGLLSARTNRPELVEKYGFDVKFGAHAVRLGMQGVELLRTGQITLPIPEPDRSYLLDIRRGKVSKEVVLAQIEKSRYVLEALCEASTLPEHADWDAINRWLPEIYRKWWEQKNL